MRGRGSRGAGVRASAIPHVLLHAGCNLLREVRGFGSNDDFVWRSLQFGNRIRSRTNCIPILAQQEAWASGGVLEHGLQIVEVEPHLKALLLAEMHQVVGQLKRQWLHIEHLGCRRLNNQASVAADEWGINDNSIQKWPQSLIAAASRYGDPSACIHHSLHSHPDSRSDLTIECGHGPI